MTDFASVQDLLAHGVRDRAFPAATIEVGHEGGVRWRKAVGAMTYDAGAQPTGESTVFDLASLTKVLATTPLVMNAVDLGLLDLDEPVSGRLNNWRGADRETVTVRDLLAHCSGLTAYLPFFRDYRGRVEFERAICELPLEYPPRTQSIYSDLGFMLLGFILEDIARQPLADQFATISGLVAPEPLTFRPPASWRPRTAPTETDPWRGRLLAGEVHDENAWALGGAAGHAGLFGTAAAVGSFARLVLATLRHDTPLGRRDTWQTFTRRRDDVPGSSRALGWDTMLPTSSCGTMLSPSAIGHTGFTGTSLWIDPARDLYIVLLTNRVHPTRENDKLKTLRPLVHDAVIREVADGTIW
jgi:CubicO group peptidase (beta-lactamase class C family)